MVLEKLRRKGEEIVSLWVMNWFPSMFVQSEVTIGIPF